MGPEQSQLHKQYANKPTIRPGAVSFNMVVREQGFAIAGFNSHDHLMTFLKSRLVKKHKQDITINNISYADWFKKD